MANLVIASNSKAMPRLDGSIKNKVWAFIEKLSADHTAPGLHIEPLNAAVDPRVRTGRVDIHFRAILFKIDDKLGDDPTFIYMGTWPHDEANKLAERSRLRVNPINGVLEGIIGELDGENDRKKRTVVPDPRGELDRAIKARPKSYLAERFSLADLTERLGLEPELAERAYNAIDEDTLLDIAANAVGWQGSALLDLATGLHIDSIREKHGFTDAPVDDTLDEDEQILKALEQPASKMQFTFVEDDEELRRVIEGGDFAAWRTFLHPEQRKYVEQNHSGAFRLSGGAGTGKTVVATPSGKAPRPGRSDRPDRAHHLQQDPRGRPEGRTTDARPERGNRGPARRSGHLRQRHRRPRQRRTEPVRRHRRRRRERARIPRRRTHSQSHEHRQGVARGRAVRGQRTRQQARHPWVPRERVRRRRSRER